MAGPIDKKRWGNLEITLWDGDYGKSAAIKVSMKEGEAWSSIPVTKSYKAKDGEFKTSKFLFASDLRKLAGTLIGMADSMEEGKTREPVDIGDVTDSRQMDFTDEEIPF
jgi:hypothetical protein